MVDRYTKVILTIIAVALVALAVRPLFETRLAGAADSMDVRIVGISSDVASSRYAIPVLCVDGCRSR
jgi:hypothetical protein